MDDLHGILELTNLVLQSLNGALGRIDLALDLLMGLRLETIEFGLSLGQSSLVLSQQLGHLVHGLDVVLIARREVLDDLLGLSLSLLQGLEQTGLLEAGSGRDEPIAGSLDELITGLDNVHVDSFIHIVE